jgi:hypothetical protein
MIKKQPNFKTFFRSRQIDMDGFLSATKEYIFTELLNREIECNLMYRPPGRLMSSSATTWSGDVLLLQWGNIQFTTYNKDLSYNKYSGNQGSRLILGTVDNPVRYKTDNSIYKQCGGKTKSTLTYDDRKNADGSWKLTLGT